MKYKKAIDACLHNKMPIVIKKFEHYLFIDHYQGCANFAERIFRKIGRQNQKGNCWHNKKKYTQLAKIDGLN